MKGGWTYVFAVSVVYVGVILKKITLHLGVKVRIQFLLIFYEVSLFIPYCYGQTSSRICSIETSCAC